MPTYRPKAETIEAVRMPEKSNPGGLGAVYASGLIVGAHLNDSGVMCRFASGVRARKVPFGHYLLVEGGRVKVLPPDEFEAAYTLADPTGSAK